MNDSPLHPDAFVRFVRWFNAAVPWQRYKPRLTIAAERRLPSPPTPQIFDGIFNRLKMRLDLDVYYQRLIYLNGYENVLLKLLRRLLRPGDVYLDGGADIGLMTLLAGDRVGSTGAVYAFEPDPLSLDVLRENVALNDLNHVTIVPRGCAAAPGTATLYRLDRTRFPVATIGAPTETPAESETTITLTSIDTEVDRPVHVLKLDVEGSEWAALRGAERTVFGDHPPHLLIELNRITSVPMGFEPTDMVAWLIAKAPHYTPHLIRSKGIQRLSVDGLYESIRQAPGRVRMVWLAPRRASIG